MSSIRHWFKIWIIFWRTVKRLFYVGRYYLNPTSVPVFNLMFVCISGQWWRLYVAPFWLVCQWPRYPKMLVACWPITLAVAPLWLVWWAPWSCRVSLLISVCRPQCYIVKHKNACVIQPNLHFVPWWSYLPYKKKNEIYCHWFSVPICLPVYNRVELLQYMCLSYESHLITVGGKDHAYYKCA